MKGKATFTLTKADTGKVIRQFTEHNIVTDAAQRLLNPPGCAIMNKFSWSDHLSAALPLYKNYFGGLLLLGNTLTERADNIMLTPDCIPIATAGGDYSGSLTTRGSLNLNESYETADGYHFTWDFGTDKANGTIKCAALTSTAFGNSGLSGSGSGGVLLEPTLMEPGNLNSRICRALGIYIGTFSRCTHTYITREGNEVIFRMVKTPDPDSLGINAEVGMSTNIEPYSTVRVELPITISSIAKPFVDSSAGKVYFFSPTYTEDEVVKLDHAEVSLSDFSVSEKNTWILPSYFNVTTAAVYGGKLYLAYNNTIFAISSSGSVVDSWEASSDSYAWFSMLGGVLTLSINGSTGYYYLGGEWYGAPGYNLYGFGYSCDMQAPYFPASLMTSNYQTTQNPSVNPFLAVAGSYLATINNLSEPLEKTNEHTLKITYDITN
ncbi:MAG: hypothetical protein SPD47_05285 [Oscillospiraceae bacterium]|nr:hypothetical protein [Oscillospiraceae bacterium]